MKTNTFNPTQLVTLNSGSDLVSDPDTAAAASHFYRSRLVAP